MAWVRRARGRVEVVWREAGRQRQERVKDERFVRVILAEKQKVEDEARDSRQPEGAAALVEQFIKSRRLKGCRAQTVEFYERILKPFAATHPDPSKWARATVEAYVADHPGWGPTPAQMLRRSLGALWRWARRQRIYVPDCTTGLELAPAPKGGKATLRAPELLRLLGSARGQKYGVAAALAGLAGLSLGDVLTLTWEEVDLEAGVIERPAGRQKTGQPLSVGIPSLLAAMLLEVRPLRPTGLVCRVAGNRRAANKALRRLFTRAGLSVPKWNGYHALRRTYATLLKRAGVPQPDVGAALSHRPGSRETGLYTLTDAADRRATTQALEAHLALASKASAT